jgi:hypothetical protein
MKYAIYDKPKTIDRYTLRILLTPEEYSADFETLKYMRQKYGNHFNTYFGFSENPFHPQGFGQFCGEYQTEKSYKHLGKKITICDLPEQAQKYVNQIINDYYVK